ncbi:MAG: TrkH family potassium uptake protein [Acidimicrobiia bacterium]|nr:TrkH family potassium uptake protein [Acidimicrobiia bacterium]
MHPRRLLHIIGAVVAAIGASMVAAAATSFIYQEWRDGWLILLAAAITMLAGWLTWRNFDRPSDLSMKEGFAVVGLTWIAMAIFGTLPFILTGSISDFTNAIFETSAGFSTTGASIVTDLDAMPRGILLWRSMMQWLGGMGVIVLSIAVLPFLGTGGVALAQAESPGPTPDRLTPRFRETAKRLWYLYLGLTAVEALLLMLGDMTIFEAVNHSLTTLSTGGFGTDGGSLGNFSSYSQWVVIVFMVLAGASFALHYRALRDPKEYLRSHEFKLYMAIMGGAAAAFIIGTRSGGAILDVIRDSVFTAVSIVTTTGYATADFGLWAPALQIIVFGLMFVGGMAGSTGGSVTPYRLGVLTGAARSDLRRVIHPRGVFVTRLGGDTIDDEVVETVQSFFLLYMFIFMTGTLLFAIIAEFSGGDFDIVSSGSAVASSLGNVGPALSQLGPSNTFIEVAPLNKYLLSFLMLVGRIEIYPILLLFTRELWRK